MVSLQPDQATLLLHIGVNSCRNEHALTRRVIESIPLDKGDFRPDPVSKSALELAWHTVATEKRFFKAVSAGEFDFSPSPKPDTVRNSRDLGIWYGDMFATESASLAQLGPEPLMKVLNFRGIFQMPAVFFLQFALNHSTHHRGQLSMYLRPMGAKVPAIYGESFDSSEAKKAASRA